jgi:predicted metal-dependent phosphoesterase TrpH
MSRLDLHLHTTYSDGSLPPSEVLALAKHADVSALSITDHDIVDGIPEALAIGAGLGIEVVPGVEISSRFGEGELHILGYCLDWQDDVLRERLAQLRAGRHRRNPRMIEKLNALGLSISYEEVKALAKTEAIGRPHIARVLMQKGYVGSAKEAFSRYLAEGKPAYVPRELPEPADAVAWIRDAHGVAVLAHPTWVKLNGENFLKLCERLKAQGLGGIEVHYSTHNAAQTAEYLDAAKRLDLLITGGSDFHGVTKPDIEVGVGRGGLHVPVSLLKPLQAAASKG